VPFHNDEVTAMRAIGSPSSAVSDAQSFRPRVGRLSGTDQAAFAETDAQKVQRLHEEATRKKREAEARGGGGGGGGRARDTESRRLLGSRG